MRGCKKRNGVNWQGGVRAKRCKTRPWCTIELFWTNTPDIATVRQKKNFPPKFLNSGPPTI